MIIDNFSQVIWGRTGDVRSGSLTSG